MRKDIEDDWDNDCIKWRGIILCGKYRHWCNDWDGLPMDETCKEWPCACAEKLKREQETLEKLRREGINKIDI